ncbi:MAG: hypothetical protein ACRD3C_14865 [Vicinamibacterales bacterium]
MTAGRRRACAAGRRRPVYSTLGVPEIWRYEVKRRRAVISVLRHGAYVEVANSRAFPMMTGDVIATFLEQSKTEGQGAALQAFRRSIRKTSCE